MIDAPFCGPPPARILHSATSPGIKSLNPRLGDPFVWQVDGLDGLDHDFHCPFVVHLGLIPCGCRSIRFGFRSLWYRRWLRWSKVRVNPGWWARNRDAPPWPIAEWNISGQWSDLYIEGWDTQTPRRQYTGRRIGPFPHPTH